MSAEKFDAEKSVMTAGEILAAIEGYLKEGGFLAEKAGPANSEVGQDRSDDSG